MGTRPEGNTNRPYGATQEGNVNRPYGATQEGNVNRPYGATQDGRTANSTFGATQDGRTANSTFGATRFGVSFSGVTGKQQPLSMVSYKLFLRTGMYLKGNVLEGNPMSTTAIRDQARADFEAELTALKMQVVRNEENQKLTLEFEPLRNNYWLNNNGYDQLIIVPNGY
jgi:hypothetical protein